jgi:hypothetical protein
LRLKALPAHSRRQADLKERPLMDDTINTAAEALENAARGPNAAAVHSEPGESSIEQGPLPEAISKKPVEDKSPAEWAYQRLILYIQNFEKTLDTEEEVAMGFTDTGAGVLRIEGLGFFDPDVVTFYGTDPSGARVQLVQHVSQLNVLLRSMPKPSEVKEPRRIGFRLAEALEEGSDG